MKKPKIMHVCQHTDPGKEACDHCKYPMEPRYIKDNSVPRK